MKTSNHIKLNTSFKDLLTSMGGPDRGKIGLLPKQDKTTQIYAAKSNMS